MFTTLFLNLTQDSTTLRDHNKAPQILRLMKELYSLTSISYMSLNIPNIEHGNSFAHCIYSDQAVEHRISLSRISEHYLDDLALLEATPQDWSRQTSHDRGLFLDTPAAPASGTQHRILSFPVTATKGEIALFAIAGNWDAGRWEEFKDQNIEDIAFLASHFHSHVVRHLSGGPHAGSIVSRREIDCLKWSARGKTAWEASRILGISERTVRFHLDSARSKLQCANTTQAVATAISQGLIAC